MRKVRSIVLIIAVAAAAATSAYLLFSRYVHDSGMRKVPAESIPITGSVSEKEKSGNPSETTGNHVEGRKKASDFELADINGKRVRLSDYEGKRVVLCFWADWSPYCIDQMTALQSLADRNAGDKDLAVLAIDVREDAQAVKEFVKSKNLKLTVLLDPKGAVSGMGGPGSGSYGIEVLPSIVYINSDGTVYSFSGHRQDMEAMQGTLDKMK